MININNKWLCSVFKVFLVVFSIILLSVPMFAFYLNSLKNEVYTSNFGKYGTDGKTFNFINERPDYNSKENKKRFSFMATMKYLFGKNPDAWQHEEIIVNQAIPGTPPVDSSIKAYFINHSTVLIQTLGLNIITDPIYSKKAGPLNMVGAKRHHAPGIKFEDLPKIDIILLSHSHYDHMDYKTLKKLIARDNPKIITPQGNDYLLKKINKNVDVTPLLWSESTTYKGLTISVEKAYHWSFRRLYDLNKALWGSFVIDNGKHKIFFAGDTAFSDGKIFEELQSKHKSFALSFIPIGAYEPNEYLKYSHANPHEAVQIHKIIHSKKTVAIHFGTFQLSKEKYRQPQEDLEKSKQILHVNTEDFIALQPGASINIK